MRTRLILCRNMNDAAYQWEKVQLMYPNFFDEARKNSLYLKSSFLDTQFYFKSANMHSAKYGFKPNQVLVDEFAGVLFSGCSLLDFSNKNDNSKKLNDEDYGSKLFEFVEENLKKIWK